MSCKPLLRWGLGSTKEMSEGQKRQSGVERSGGIWLLCRCYEQVPGKVAEGGEARLG